MLLLLLATAAVPCRATRDEEEIDSRLLKDPSFDKEDEEVIRSSAHLDRIKKEHIFNTYGQTCQLQLFSFTSSKSRAAAKKKSDAATWVILARRSKPARGDETFPNESTRDALFYLYGLETKASWLHVYAAAAQKKRAANADSSSDDATSAAQISGELPPPPPQTALIHTHCHKLQLARVFAKSLSALIKLWWSMCSENLCFAAVRAVLYGFLQSCWPPHAAQHKLHCFFPCFDETHQM